LEDLFNAKAARIFITLIWYALLRLLLMFMQYLHWKLRSAIVIFHPDKYNRLRTQILMNHERRKMGSFFISLPVSSRALYDDARGCRKMYWW